MDKPQPDSTAADTPVTAEQWTSSGWKHYALKQYPAAEASFRQAIQLDDRLTDAHYGLSVSLRSQNRTQEAIEEMKKAQECIEADESLEDPGRRTILRQLIEAQLTILIAPQPEEA